MICGGGTSSRCAANEHWTVDLRKKYNQIQFDSDNNTVLIGGGITMGNLLTELTKHERSFPIGLSASTGIGYILTGGISPLSRSVGLAIDQVLEIKGVWGNGDSFNISRPKASSNYKGTIEWKGLCGAAPFLGIVTELTLKTLKEPKLKFWQRIISKYQLMESIKQAEKLPYSFSLQWAWGDQIKIYIVMNNDFDPKNKAINNLYNDFPFLSSIKETEVFGQQNLPPFNIPFRYKSNDSKLHSEVVGLLTPEWGINSMEIINSLEHLMSIRPNPNCYIAAQQLGGVSSNINRKITSFINREAIWKPWISASWQAGNNEARAESLQWLTKVWQVLEPYCSGVHLAQMHQHLPWHQKEINSAFQEWLPGLKKLKSCYDPKGILPGL